MKMGNNHRYGVRVNKKYLSLALAVVMSTLLFHCNAQHNRQQKSLSAEEFAAALRNTPSPIILDVRTTGEFSQGFIEGAHNVDYSNENFIEKINALDKDRSYFVYCLSGARSKTAATYMRKQGFKEVYDMKGGLLEWQKINQPLTAPSAATEDEMSMEDYTKLITSYKTVLVDFYAPWCGPCKKMEPMLDAFGRENKGRINVVRLNIDENKKLAKQLGISEIPLLKIFQDGKEKWSRTGLVEKSTLTAALREL